MPLLPTGKNALVKVEQSSDGERFIIVYADAASESASGYHWTSTNAMTEDSARDSLLEFGIEPKGLPDLFKAARKHFDARLNLNRENGDD